jgi:hypothetical protein
MTHDRRADEPSRIADRIEQRQGLAHSVDALVLVQLLVV